MKYSTEMIKSQARHIFNVLAFMFSMIAFTSCDVHEFPDTPKDVAFRLKLEFETDMPINHVPFDELIGGGPTRGVLGYGEMTYIVRAYDANTRERAIGDYVKEYVFTRDVAAGYDCEFPFDLPAGDYKLMVWSQLSEKPGDASFYNYDDFSYITLQGEHAGNTDYRDAFRGVYDITLEARDVESVPATHVINMQRPLAKFEFVTNDLVEFLIKEQTRVEMISRGDGTITPDTLTAPVTRVDLAEYKVVFYYSGFMPDTYNMLTDKPVNSSVGVSFESSLNILSENEASMGFDYVFVNGRQSTVSVQIAFYDTKNVLLAMTQPVEVPLKRSEHTVVRGSFLMTKASGGVSINPDYAGDHNVIVP